MKEFLEPLAYKAYKLNKESCFVKEYVLYQKEIDTDFVCDTSERLFINIDHRIYKEEKITPSFEVSITAEKNGKWWRLLCYSLTEKELKEEIFHIEKTLLKMFNSLKEVSNEFLKQKHESNN